MSLPVNTTESLTVGLVDSLLSPDQKEQLYAQFARNRYWYVWGKGFMIKDAPYCKCVIASGGKMTTYDKLITQLASDPDILFGLA